VVGNLTWNPLGTLASLSITDPFNSADAQTCSYSHDDLTRIASANCGSIWSQTFSYDAFGNINKSGSMSFGATYSPTTNHMTLIGSSTPTYDSNGNVTNDFLHTYTWDANGRPTTADGVGLSYDALGRMVEQNRNSVYTEIVYAPKGGKLALMSGSTMQKGFVPLTGGSMAVYNTSGLAYYRHSDWIGSSRFASTPGRTTYFDGAYGPFGESYSQTGSTDLSFTGMNQDAVSNLYDFPAREYGIQGRWPSPDPAGILSVDPTDPQTWNRYPYVRNSPLILTDPTGMDDCGPLCAWGDGGCFGVPGECAPSGYPGGGCTLDGQDMPCNLVYQLLNGGGAAQCPNNVCSDFSSNGQFTQFEAFADGCAGYMSSSSPVGFSPCDIANARAAVSSAAQGKPIDPNQLTGKALDVYSQLIALGVSPENITIYQTGTQSFQAVLTDAGFNQLEQSPNFASNPGDVFLHYPYTEGGRSDQTPSLHGVWFGEDLTDYVGGSGVYTEFHEDSSNPYNGGFWGHWGCDVLHISCH